MFLAALHAPVDIINPTPTIKQANRQNCLVLAYISTGNNAPFSVHLDWQHFLVWRTPGQTASLTLVYT